MAVNCIWLLEMTCCDPRASLARQIIPCLEVRASCTVPGQSYGKGPLPPRPQAKAAERLGSALVSRASALDVSICQEGGRSPGLWALGHVGCWLGPECPWILASSALQLDNSLWDSEDEWASKTPTRLLKGLSCLHFHPAEMLSQEQKEENKSLTTQNSSWRLCSHTALQREGLLHHSVFINS